MQCFVAVADELHFGRAAAKLHIVQPAVSQQVRMLEKELGVTLFDRSSRRVALTEVGRLYHEEARKALRQVEAATQLARDAADGLRGELRIGFVDNAIWSCLSTVLRAFREAFPGIELTLSQAPRTTQVLLLLAGDLDVAVLPAPVTANEIRTQSLISAPLEIVLPAGHPLCANAVVQFADLAGENFVSFSSASNPRRIDEIISSICADAGFTPILGQAVEQMHTALALVSAGMGVACVPPWMRRAWTDGVEYRGFVPEHRYELVLATLRRRVNSRIDALFQIADQIRAESAAPQQETIA